MINFDSSIKFKSRKKDAETRRKGNTKQNKKKQNKNKRETEWLNKYPKTSTSDFVPREIFSGLIDRRFKSENERSATAAPRRSNAIWRPLPKKKKNHTQNFQIVCLMLKTDFWNHVVTGVKYYQEYISI